MDARILVCVVLATWLLAARFARADDAPAVPEPPPASEAESPPQSPAPTTPPPTPVLIFQAPTRSPDAPPDALPPPVVPAPPDDTHVPAPPHDDAMDEGAADQDPPRTALNALYFELLGLGLLYSVSYDRVLDHDLSLRIGFSHFEFSLFSAPTSLTFVPVVLNYIGIGSVDHIFELGVGATFVHSSRGSSSGQYAVMPSVGLGYRYQPSDGGTLFRIGVSVMAILDDDRWMPLPWPYLALGWTG